MDDGEPVNYSTDRSPSESSVSSDHVKNTGGGSYGKSRKPNWTDVEIRTLIQEYDKYRDVMRNRGGYGADGEKKKGFSNEEKHNVWKVITEAVNRSKVDGINLSGSSICERTVKEVIKKWVNLVNKMKCDLAAQRRHPGIGMCVTSRALNTILNTNDPLDMDSVMTQSISQNWPRVDMPEDDSYGSGSSAVKIEPEENNEYMKKYRPIAPKNLRNVILQRNITPISKEPEELHKEPLQEPLQSEVFSPNKRPRFDTMCNGFQPANDSMDEQDNSLDETGENDVSAFGTFNADYHTDDFMQLNKDVLELKKKKLMVKIDKLLLDKEKAVFDKERAKVEKETAVMAYQKMKLELEILKKSLDK